MVDFDIESAREEVQNKAEEEIEMETAYKWASRAIACYQLYNETEMLEWFLQAESYRHEAIEHASLTGDQGSTVRLIESEVNKHRILKS